MSKCLIASLFASNSGGILTVLNTSQKLNNPHFSGITFVIGLILALISATALQEFYNRVCDPLADMIDYQAKIEAGCLEDPAARNEIAKRMEAASRWAWVPPALGWLSGLAFVTGASAVAFGFKG